MKNEAGISLIVLIITIIVIVILAGAIILSIANNNPITQASDAVTKNNAAVMQDQLNLAIASMYAKNGVATTINGEPSSFISNLSSTQNDKFWVENNKLYAVENKLSESELKSLIDSGMGVIYNKGLTNVKQIACGANYTVTLMNDGTVLSWGSNWSGQLGLGDTVDRKSPTLISGLTNVKQIFCGDSHTFAILNNGDVMAWGANGWGQLGDGTTNQKNRPTLIANLKNAKQIVGGQYYTVILYEDGTVKTCGMNNYGQLGNGNFNAVYTPYTVLTGAKQVACGYNGFSFAVLNDGTVKSWGCNNSGQLGTGTSGGGSILTPTFVKSPDGSNLTKVSAISAGWAHAVAVMDDGTLTAWGYNQNGQLGDGTTTNKVYATVVPGLTNVKQVACGIAHNTIALLNDGTVKAWGLNSCGQLCDGTTISTTTPIIVPNVSGVQQIACGYHTDLLLSGGIIKSWGDNSTGNLATRISSLPTTISLSNIKQIISGGSYMFAILNDGKVLAWGSNEYGQLGDGTTISKFNPVVIPDLTDVKQIACSSSHTVAVMNDGTVKAWGNNIFGQLGDGTTVNKLTPTTIPDLTDVKQVACGSLHTVAVMNDGTVKAWGRNNAGQLGIGTTDSTPHTTPIAISGLTNVKQISCGSYFTIAVLNDGTAKSWGHNSMYQLGLGVGENKSVPTVIPDLTDVSQIQCGGYFALALLNDGTVKGWGDNRFGQLGNSAAVDYSQTPVAVTDVNNVIQLCANSSSSSVVALLNDGTVKGWGDNNSGQLGDGTTTNQSSPEVISGLTGISQISNGAGYTAFLTNKGILKISGINSLKVGTLTSTVLISQ